jgi:titin
MSINISQPTPAPELFRGQIATPKPGIGNFIVSKAGLDEAATLTGLEDLKQALIEGTGWQMGLTLTGEASQLTNDGEAVRVTLVKGENAAFTGSGFMPGTTATVWLFSDPNLLGKVSVGSDGSFDGTSIAFPENLTAGEHTVQIQAVGSDGFIRSANIGVEVRNPSSAAAGFWSILGWLPPVLLGLLVLGAIWLVAISRRRGRRAVGSNVIQFPRAA